MARCAKAQQPGTQFSRACRVSAGTPAGDGGAAPRARRVAGAQGGRWRRACLPAWAPRDRACACDARTAGRRRRDRRPSRRAFPGRTATGVGAGRSRYAPCRPCNQRGRVQRDLAWDSRGRRFGPCTRTTLRSTLRFFPPGNGEHLAGVGRPARGSRRSCRRGRRVPVVAAEPPPRPVPDGGDRTYRTFRPRPRASWLGHR